MYAKERIAETGLAMPIICSHNNGEEREAVPANARSSLAGREKTRLALATRMESAGRKSQLQTELERQMLARKGKKLKGDDPGPG